MNVLSLFDGISCGQLALNRANIPYDEYYASEIDQHTIAVTQHHYPLTIQLGNVTTINIKDLPKINLLIGGSPCQDLSCLKNGKGLKGNKSKLLYDYVDILNKCKPDYFLLENVVPRKQEWQDIIDELVGVLGIKINSDRFIGQNRPRIYWTNIPISTLPERPNWKRKYYQYRRTYFRENKSGVCPCLTANMGTGGHNVPLNSENLKDKLSVIECEQLQTLPYNYTNVTFNKKSMSNSQRYKMIGNCWTVDVVAHIFQGLNNKI